MLQIDSYTSFDFPCVDQHVFFVLDTSGSMSGHRIHDLNQAMESVISDLALFNRENEWVNLKIALLEYNSICRWVTPSPVPAEEMEMMWKDFEAGGATFFGTALRELGCQLGSDRMLQSETGARPPFVVFVTDGLPADPWEDALRELWENDWYRAALKFAVAIGESADTEILTKVVGCLDVVFSVSDGCSTLRSLDEISLIIKEYAPLHWEEPSRDHENRMWDYIPSPEELEQVRDQVRDMENRKKCKLLKAVRKLFADANGIPCEITECFEEGQCTGMCPRCEEEIQTLSQLLTNRAAQGNPLAFPSNDTDVLEDYLPCVMWGEW